MNVLCYLFSSPKIRSGCSMHLIPSHHVRSTFRGLSPACFTNLLHQPGSKLLITLNIPHFVQHFVPHLFRSTFISFGIEIRSGFARSFLLTDCFVNMRTFLFFSPSFCCRPPCTLHLVVAFFDELTTMHQCTLHLAPCTLLILAICPSSPFARCPSSEQVLRARWPSTLAEHVGRARWPPILDYVGRARWPSRSEQSWLRAR